MAVSFVASPQVAVQASMDGKVWEEVRFKYKPGLTHGRPPFVGEDSPLRRCPG